jgi:hypothetical protein
MRFSKVVLGALSLVLTGCYDFTPVEKHTLNRSSVSGTLAQTQGPCQLDVQCLSEKDLLQLSRSDTTTTAKIERPLTTVAIKLRVQSTDAAVKMPELLSIQAPQYSYSEAQNALFYHMAEAGYVQLAGKRIPAQTAYAEMTMERERWVDIVFIFTLPRQELSKVGLVTFVLDKAFFLTQPVAFALPASQLLPAL